MRRDGLESDYDRVRRQSGFGRKPQPEFPEDEPDHRGIKAAERVAASLAEFKQQMAAIDAADDEARRSREAEMDAWRVRLREGFIEREYAAAGIKPPHPMEPLSFLLSLGWRVENNGHEAVLVRPPTRPSPTRKTREEHMAEQLKAGF